MVMWDHMWDHHIIIRVRSQIYYRICENNFTLPVFIGSQPMNVKN